MSFEESDVINKALSYLKEDNVRINKSRFVKISARLTGVKENNRGQFNPVHFWLDRASGDSQSKVKQEIQYDGSTVQRYLQWIQSKFLRYINDFVDLNRYVQGQAIDNNGTDVPFKNYLSTLIDTPDGDFTGEPFYIKLDEVMSYIFDMILNKRLSGSSSSTDDSTSTGYAPGGMMLSYGPAPKAVQFTLGTSNVMEGYDEVPAYAFIKQKCEGAIAGLGPAGNQNMGLYHVTGSARPFDFDKWWKNLPTLYMNNSRVLAILQQSISEVLPETVSIPNSDTLTPSFPPGTIVPSVNPIRTSAFKFIEDFKRKKANLSFKDKNLPSEDGSARTFTLYQLGIKQSVPVEESTSRSESRSEDTSVDDDLSMEDTMDSDEEVSSSPESTRDDIPIPAPIDSSVPSTTESPFNMTDEDFQNIWDSITGRTSSIDTKKVSLAISLRKRGTTPTRDVDVIVKRTEIDSLVNSLLSEIQSDLQKRSAQIQKGFDDFAQGLQKAQNVTLKGITNTGTGLQELKKFQSPTRGKL